MKALKQGDTVGFVACSNGLRKEEKRDVESLVLYFEEREVNVKLSKNIYRKEGSFSGTGRERADELNSMFLDKSIKAIFDLSGGDLCNQVLDYVDWKIIKDNPKMYFGMSDLSVLLNSIYKETGNESCHFFIKNILKSKNDNLAKSFYETMFNGKKDLFDIEYEYIRGSNLEGTVIGGNIRCFLKLMGTKYLPNPENKVLLLEALEGNDALIASLLAQLKQTGYLNKLNGILLGNFRQMQTEKISPTVEQLTLEATRDLDIPIIKTNELGHRSSAKGIIIGRYRKF